MKDPRSLLRHFNFAIIVVPAEMFGDRATAFRKTLYRRVAESYLEYELIPDYAGFERISVDAIVKDVCDRMLGEAAKVKVKGDKIIVDVEGCPLSPFSMLKKYESLSDRTKRIIQDSIRKYPACPVVNLIDELCRLAGHDVEILHDAKDVCSRRCTITVLSRGEGEPKQRGDSPKLQ
ncbi:hypothetical protein [Methanopyrus sp.]